MAGPRDPVGVLLRQAILLQRVANGLVRDSDDLIKALFDDIVAELVKLDPTGVQPRYRRDRVGRLLERVAQLAGAAFDDWTKQTRASLAAVGKQQGEAAAQVLVATLGDEAKDLVRFEGPSVNMMKAIIDEDPFQGDILSQWAENQAAATVRRVRQQTQLGMVHEETIDQLVRRIRGTSNGRGGFVGGVLQTTTREAEAIVRTAVTHVATRAALDTYRANEDITKEWQFVATLDSRTTPICRALDGKTFRYDDPSAPKPPRHFNCRSHAAPVIDWASLGIDPPDPGTRAARDPTTGKTVQVSATLDYEAWLKRQPASFQDEVLGPRRAKLFREGKVTLGDLVRSDGTVVRLDQLPGAPRREASTPRAPEPSSRLVRSEAQRAHELIAAIIGDRNSVTDRNVAAVRREVWHRMAGAPGMEALARELGWSERVMLRTDVAANSQAEWVGAQLTRFWERMGNTADKSWIYALQYAGIDEFGLATAPTAHFKGPARKQGAELYRRHGDALRAYLRVQQQATAEQLKEAGIESLTLFRGIKDTFPVGESGIGIWREQPLASYTPRVDVAMGFALGEDSLGGGFRPKAGSTLIAVRIPVERIMSFPRTGIGSWPEEEFVVMDGEHEARIIDVSGDYEMLTDMYRRDRRKIIEWFWNTEGAR